MNRATTVIGGMTYIKGEEEYRDQCEMVIRILGDSTDDEINIDFNPGIYKDDVLVIRIEPEALMQALTRALRRCPEPK